MSARGILSRSLGLSGNLAVTVSLITPTASVFITGSVLLGQRGTAAFISFLVAGVAALLLAFCFAELGSRYPITGGYYSLVLRALGRPAGFVAFVLFLVQVVLILSAEALGAATYLKIVWHHLDINLVGLAVVVIATGVACLRIRMSAAITGFFLVLELAAVATVFAAGLVGLKQPPSALMHPRALGAAGHLTSVGFVPILAGVTLALMAYEGYGMATVLSEETLGPSKRIGQAVMIALGIGVITELAPITGAILGAPSLSKLISSNAPLLSTVGANFGSSVRTAVSLGVSLALVNAAIAHTLATGRVLFSSGRDQAWPERVSRFIARVNPRLRTPLVATAICGLGAAVLTATSRLATVVTFVAMVILAIYVLITISALVNRMTQRGAGRPFRMPLWPVPPLLALAITIAAMAEQRISDLVAVLVIVAIALVYWAGYLRPRSSSRWRVLPELAPASHQPPSTDAEQVAGHKSTVHPDGRAVLRIARRKQL